MMLILFCTKVHWMRKDASKISATKELFATFQKFTDVTQFGPNSKTSPLFHQE